MVWFHWLLVLSKFYNQHVIVTFLLLLVTVSAWFRLRIPKFSFIFDCVWIGLTLTSTNVICSGGTKPEYGLLHIPSKLDAVGFLLCQLQEIPLLSKFPLGNYSRYWVKPDIRLYWVVLYTPKRLNFYYIEKEGQIHKGMCTAVTLYYHCTE